MDYMHFTFDGISSEYFNLLVQNNGQDLSYPSRPDFSNEIASPLYQGTSYLAGVNISDREFTFSCWADSLVEQQVRDMSNWLNVNKIGYLVLDYNPNFKYKVKISDIDLFKHYAINADGTKNYEFIIKFVTIGDPAAISFNTYSSVAGYSPNGFLRGYTSGGDYYFYNTYNLPFYFNFTISNSTTQFTIKKNDTIYYQYDLDGSYTIDSRIGFCIDDNNALIEESLTDTDTYINLGPLEVESNIQTIYCQYSSGALQYDTSIFNDTTTRVYRSDSTKLYSVFTINQMINDHNLEEGDLFLLHYIRPTKLTIYPDEVINFTFNYRDNF